MKAIDKILAIEDIHHLTERISLILDKPVIVENKNFELIAYSSPSDYQFDPTQQKTILSKKCPIFVVDRLKKEGIVGHLESKTDPLRVEPIQEIGFYQRRLVVRASHNGQTMGSIWVQESKSFLLEEELLFLQDISAHVGKLIHQMQSKKQEKDSEKDQLLWKIINHDYVSEQQIRREAEKVNVILPKKFTVIVLSSDEAALADLESLVRRQLVDLPVSYYLKSDSKIIIIVGESAERVNTEHPAKALVEQYRDKIYKKDVKPFLIGVGNMYHRLRDMRKSFLEALEVIEIAEFVNLSSEDVPVDYSKLGMYRYLIVLYEKNMSEQFVNYDLLKLLKKDEENQSKLLQTLEVYLAHNCKSKKTAEFLFIHPNTLNYRLKQIIELTGINFKDFNVKSQLYTELLLLNHIPDYYKMYQKAEALEGDL